MAMQLLFYASGNDQHAKRLEAAVQEVVPKGRTETFTSLDDFRERLRSYIEPDSVAVLLASKREELQRMELLRGLLTEIYVVMVIPDQKKSTIDLAHRLLPRFLSQKRSDFSDLKAVLNRMYLNSKKSPSRTIPREA
jgi:hypothetical protein